MSNTYKSITQLKQAINDEEFTLFQKSNKYYYSEFEMPIEDKLLSFNYVFSLIEKNLLKQYELLSETDNFLGGNSDYGKALEYLKQQIKEVSDKKKYSLILLKEYKNGSVIPFNKKSNYRIIDKSDCFIGDTGEGLSDCNIETDVVKIEEDSLFNNMYQTFILTNQIKEDLYIRVKLMGKTWIRIPIYVNAKSLVEIK